MTLDHYLDDFILVGPSYSQDCKILMDAFFQVCKDLGVSIAEEKTCGPTTSLIFLGLVIDTHDLTVNMVNSENIFDGDCFSMQSVGLLRYYTFFSQETI